MRLEGLGLTAAEAAAYHVVVGLPSTSAAELAAALTTDPDEAGALLEGLQARGLVARSGTSPQRFVASPPAVALGALIVSRHEQLRRAELEVQALADAYRGASTTRTVSDVVDVVHGAHAVAQRFSQLQSGAVQEVLAFVKAGVLVVSAEDNLEEEAAVERGVSYRVIVERAVVERPGFVSDADQALAVGEEIRVARSLPNRMVIVDRAFAMLPMVPKGEGAEVGALLVHASPLMDMMVELFEATWRSSVALAGTGQAGSGERGHGLSVLDLRVVRLLHAGLTDRAVATQLGLSMRTVQRRVRLMMDLAEADTRFQLGVEAARRGWTAQR